MLAISAWQPLIRETMPSAPTIGGLTLLLMDLFSAPLHFYDDPYRTEGWQSPGEWRIRSDWQAWVPSSLIQPIGQTQLVGQCSLSDDTRMSKRFRGLRSQTLSPEEALCNAGPDEPTRQIPKESPKYTSLGREGGAGSDFMWLL